MLKDLDKGYYAINMYFKVKTSYIGDLYILGEEEKKNIDLVKTNLGYRELLSIIIRIRIEDDNLEDVKSRIYAELSYILFYLFVY